MVQYLLFALTILNQFKFYFPFSHIHYHCGKYKFKPVEKMLNQNLCTDH